MSQTCVFVDIKGNTFVQQSLSDSKLFAIIKGYIPNAKLLLCYMGWRLYGAPDDEQPNDVATVALGKIYKRTCETRLNGAVAFCFRSPSSKAYENMICE